MDLILTTMSICKAVSSRIPGILPHWPAARIPFGSSPGRLSFHHQTPSAHSRSKWAGFRNQRGWYVRLPSDLRGFPPASLTQEILRFVRIFQGKTASAPGHCRCPSRDGVTLTFWHRHNPALYQLSNQRTFLAPARAFLNPLTNRSAGNLITIWRPIHHLKQFNGLARFAAGASPSLQPDEASVRASERPFTKHKGVCNDLQERNE